MAYKRKVPKILRPLPHQYEMQQHSAMRWLAKQGMTPEEIREATWGIVDEEKKAVRIAKSMVRITYDPNTCAAKVKVENKDFWVDAKGSGHEDFFFKSRIYCGWMFVKYVPFSWRKENNREKLYSLSEVESYCRGIESTSITSSILTNLDNFGRMKLSNLNITRMETEELKRRAQEAKVMKN